MRALLYKDFLVAKQYLRMILLMSVIFIVVGVVNPDQTYFLIFPMVMTTADVVALISYDERFHWDRTCDMLPVSRAAQVTEKYLLHALWTLALFLLCAAAILLRGSGDQKAMQLLVLLMMGLLPAAVMLPIVFRVGVEKARLLYYVVVFGGMMLSMALSEGEFPGLRVSGGLGLLLSLVCLVLYALSWWLSLRFYEEREL